MLRKLAELPGVRLLYYACFGLVHEFRYNIFSFFPAVAQYFLSILQFSSLPKNPANVVRISNLMPMLADRTVNTPVEPIYLLQDAWACGELFQYKPKKHVDIASYAKTVAIMSQFVPTTFVDIRPIAITLDNLDFIEGSILELPFKNNSVESISSLCVIEHIGLGRYGDPLDTFGSEKALLEIQRVLKKGGHLLVSVPVSKNSTVFFNAHRAFEPQLFHSLIPKCRLISESYIYGTKIFKSFKPSAGVGVGLFHYKKI